MRGFAQLLLTLIIGAILPQSAFAYGSDAALERDGQLCSRHLAGAERRYGIPSNLLSAVAVTESGRRHKRLGVQVPWPWSINVEGKGYLFDTKEEAVAAVQKYRAQGKRSIDVGCMQVNLHHHPDAFSSIANAFEPRYNVEYAAKFLRRNYDETQSWRTAVGYYHSRTPTYSVPYAGRVYSAWHGMTNRMNQARNSVYASYISVGGKGQQVVLGSSEAVRERSLSAIRKPNEKISATTSSSSKIIRVTNKNNSKGRDDLIIIRPTSSKKAEPEIVLSQQETSPEINPVVLDTQRNKPQKTMRVVRAGDNLSQSDWTNDDSRIIRFTQ